MAARRTSTTILLEPTGEGWRATQHGVDLVGHGPTAARAAQRYCELIAESEAFAVDA